MKKSILILSGCVGMLCLSLLSACSKDEEGTNPPDDGGGDNEEEVVDGDDEEDAVLTLSLDSITVDSGAGRQTVELTSNTEWEIDNPNSLLSWCVVSPVRGQAGTVTLTVEVSANESYDMREHTFNIVAGTETVSLTVSQTQFGYLDFRLASKGGNIFLDEGGICEVLATTSIEYEIEYTDNGAEWVSLQQTKALEEETLSFLIAEYTGDSQRECDIVFKEVGGEKDTIHIVQYHDTEVEFEDAEFERYCLEHFDDDGDGRIIGREVRDIREMNVSELGLTSLSGIEAFENLEVLYCSDNELSSLDLRQNKKLKTLDCNDNPLISLDVSGLTSLQSLDCNYNNLTSLDVSGLTSLQSLDCNYNNLTSLDVSGLTSLQSLDCNYNNLTSLDVSGLTSLQSLDCYSSNLTSLSASGCIRLQSLNFGKSKIVNINLSGCVNLKIDWLEYGTSDFEQLEKLDLSGCPGVQTMILLIHQLTSVDVSGCTNLYYLRFAECCNLTTLDVSGCINLTSLWITHVNGNLTSLDLSGCSALQQLVCCQNQLTSLDLSDCPALNGLNCASNQLTDLDLSNCPALNWLNCASNQLTDLDLSNCPALNELFCGFNQLTTLDISNCPALNRLYCDFNQLTTLDVSCCPDLYYFSCGDNPLQSMTILQEQMRYWMEDIMMQYPDIEIIVK